MLVTIMEKIMPATSLEQGENNQNRMWSQRENDEGRQPKNTNLCEVLENTWGEITWAIDLPTSSPTLVQTIRCM